MRARWPPTMMSRYLLPCATLALLCGGLFAQAPETDPDSITLTNGDVLTGTVVAMTDGELTFQSGPAGELKIPLESIANLTTAGTIPVHTVNGDVLMRSVTGISGGQIQLAAGDGPAMNLNLDTLGSINPPPPPPVAWTGYVNFTGSISDGNTKRRSAGLLAHAERRTPEDRLTLDANWDYAQDNPTPQATGGTYQLTQRRTGGRIKYDYFFTEKAYIWANTGAEGDTLQNIDLRWTAGAGLGYQFYEEKDFKLNGEVGASYFVENYRSTLPDVDYLALRLAYSIYWQISESVLFLQTAEAFPSVEQSSDFYGKLDSQLQVSLTESMFAALQAIVTYDNTPTPGFDRIDERYILSIGWTF